MPRILVQLRGIAGIELADQTADFLHGPVADIRIDQVDRVAAAPRSGEQDGLGHFIELQADQRLQLGQPGRGFRPRQLPQIDRRLRDAPARRLVRRQIGVAAGQQIAALPGLGFGDIGELAVQRALQIMRPLDLRRAPIDLHVHIAFQADRQQRQGQDRHYRQIRTGEGGNRTRHLLLRERADPTPAPLSKHLPRRDGSEHFMRAMPGCAGPEPRSSR